MFIGGATIFMILFIFIITSIPKAEPTVEELKRLEEYEEDMLEQAQYQEEYEQSQLK